MKEGGRRSTTLRSLESSEARVPWVSSQPVRPHVAPGSWTPPAVPLRGVAPPAVVRLSEPGRVHPEVCLRGAFPLAAGAPEGPADRRTPAAHGQCVAVLHVGLPHLLRLDGLYS